MNEDSSEDANCNSFICYLRVEHTCAVFDSVAGVLFCAYKKVYKSQKHRKGAIL